MRATSATWNALHASDAGILETKAVINGAEYTEISAPIISRAAMQNAMTVGNVISASCVFTIRTTDTIPKAAKVEIMSRYTDEEQYSEWMSMGTFYISKRQRDPISGLLALECYDSLLKANAAMLEDTPWTNENGVTITDETNHPIRFEARYPRSMVDVATDIAAAIGLTIDPRSDIGTGDNYVISSVQAGATMRDVLGIIAAANGGNWIVTPDNKLRLLPVVSADGADTAENIVDVTAVVGSLQVGDERTVSGVQYTYGENAIPVLIGDYTGYIMNVSLQFEYANLLAQKVIGMVYRPYSMANCRYTPAAEIGDFIRYGDVFAGVMYAETATYGIVLNGDIQSPDFTEVLDEYPYVGASQSALNQAKAYTEQRVADAAAIIEESLTQEKIFNLLTGGGEEQGVILYQDKIYINASYIQTGTISADILKGGILTLGGANNVNGTLRVIDVDGNVVNTVDNTGIASQSANGLTRAFMRNGGFSLQYYDEAVGPPLVPGWNDSLSFNDTASSESSIVSNMKPLNIRSPRGFSILCRSNDSLWSYRLGRLQLGQTSFALSFDGWNDADPYDLPPTMDVEVSPDGGITITAVHYEWVTPEVEPPEDPEEEEPVPVPEYTKITRTATYTKEGVLTVPVVKADNGASGSFTTRDGRTVTVENGIITKIS